MQRMGPVGRLSRTVDHAVRWRIGLIGVHPGPVVAPAETETGDLWAESSVLDPAAASARPVLPRSGRRSGARFYEISAPSRGPGDHPGSGSVFGRVAVHPDPGAPAVLLLHGYGAVGPFYEERHMRQLLRRGISSARIELPFHMHRRVPGRAPGSGFFSSDPAQTRVVLRQATEDAAAVVAWLRRELTPTVGALGFSLGGLVACLTGALVPLDSLVSVTPPCDLAELTLERTPPRLRRELGIAPGGGGPWGSDRAEARAALDRAMAPVIPRMLTPRTPRHRITLVAAEHDLIVGTTPVRELAAVWGAECWLYRHGHVTVMSARGLSARIHERLARDLGPGTARSGAIA